MSKLLSSLLPIGLVIDRTAIVHERVVVTVHAKAGTAACPDCRRFSRRVHSRYLRRLGDLPWQGRVGQIDLQIRRFRCATPECPRRIFAEQLPEVAAPRVRRTTRLAETQRRIALAVGGEAGARLASRLALPVSADTLLRLIRAKPVSVTTTPRVIGIDDWAWRRGQRYGTLIVDLERNRPVDLLPNRDAQTVAAWLKRHPGIEMVARDRAGAYADGIRHGAPEAVQVADRWHLLRNLSDALTRALDRHQPDLRAATASVVEVLQSVQAEPEVPSASSAMPPAADRHATRRAWFDEALALHGQGWSVRRIARALGVDRQTVQGWLRSGHLPTWSQQPRGSSIDRHADHLRRRWDEGCRNAAELWREIRQQGFCGQLRTVQRWVRQCRSADPTAPGPSRATVAWLAPSKQRVAWLVVADRERLNVKEQRFVDTLMASSPALYHVISLAREFRNLVRRKKPELLDEWVVTARRSALAGFAEGLARDIAAVRAGLSLPWSTGPVEGQISRLKTIKRTMCGRAGFELLRHRVLEAA